MGYEREKKPKGMTMKEWGVSRFTPNPKYKKPYCKWMFYARFKRSTSWGVQYECIPFLAPSKKEAIKQIKKFAKMTGRTVLKFWRHGPLSWNGIKAPWVLEKKK